MAAEFDITSSGPVAFAWEDQPCAGYRITGSAPARGTFIGDNAMFETRECARPDYQTGVNHVDGEAVVKATSGDEIHIHYFGDSPVADQKSGDFADDLTFDIAGGTGQFDGATGSGRLVAHGNINENPCIVESRLTGTIELAAVASQG